MKNKFLRVDSFRYSKLGKNRRKLRKWRRSKGRHNKMRVERKSYPASPKIGYKSQRKNSGKISGLKQRIVYNVGDLNFFDKGSAAIISRKIGAKKKIELLKLASEKNIRVLNIGRKNET